MRAAISCAACLMWSRMDIVDSNVSLVAFVQFALFHQQVHLTADRASHTNAICSIRASAASVLQMVAELQKPAREKLQQMITANVEWATEHLLAVGNLPVGLWNARASDKVRATEVLAKMHSWNAPECGLDPLFSLGLLRFFAFSPHPSFNVRPMIGVGQHPAPRFVVRPFLARRGACWRHGGSGEEADEGFYGRVAGYLIG